MTGFGKSGCELPDKIVSIEIRSLNSKQLDIFTRIPNLYREKELELRNLISQKLKRGKVELTITYENTDTAITSKINTQLVRQYYMELSKLAGEMGAEDEKNTLLQTIMRFPDALKVDKEELNEKEWQIILEKIEEALQAILAFREQEGEALEKDILHRVRKIISLLEKISAHESDRIEKVRERILASLQESFGDEKVDESRFEQELIYYIEKLDITEEQVRLRNHCEFFMEVAAEADTVGKKLGFISQEMGREINTIGSKANHAEIQRLVVQMKDELEKIKEQLMNVL